MAWADMADRVLKTTIATFKTAGTYTRAADPGTPIAIDGVFDKPNRQVDPQTGAAVESVQPSFGIRLADLPAEPESGDGVTVNGVQYQVISVEEDGQGGAKLVLHRQG